MLTKPFALAACTAIATLTGTSALAAEPFAWPEGKKAAVVLTYDDSMPSHLDIAIPALDAAGIKGTFFLNGTFANESVERWRATAESGHELGNHSVFHPCRAGSFEMPEQYHLENYSVATMLNELRVMNNLLTALDGKAMHTYATPCGNTLAGGEDFIAPIMEAGFAPAIRGVAAPEHDPNKIELNAVPSEWFPEDASGKDMIRAVKAVEKEGGLLVIGFHGVGADYLTVPAASHKELADYLGAHTDEIWVAPFGEVMAWVATHQSEAD
ncbi:polysaccharide deacetylase family protein [Parvularcula sp. LCG005]|uniref:polysaccharide deacetylase family protein n=1 Tax=Parvularcula sp. LCG005 TaxID=3078805 RepID=UPI002943A57C|nr:polysaccharide deacetylase family protein [Parvularcula sp. LCG005]WOI53867.1 polysaccharide deacetylase family protein [Parvularcula sp. LCG005]